MKSYFEKLSNGWRADLPEPPDQFDPLDEEHVEQIIKQYNVEIEADHNEKYPGWGVLWKGGGGIFCPFLKNDEDGRKARAIIALQIYLHAIGVEVSICARLAYHFIVASLEI